MVVLCIHIWICYKDMYLHMYIHRHSEEAVEMTYLGKKRPYGNDLYAFKDLLYPIHFSLDSV